MSESVGGRERRLSPRYSVSLECGLALPEGERSSGLLFPNTALAGRTRDVSETGLGVVVESIYIGYDCVVDRGRSLLVSLALPSGVVEMQAAPMHYVRHERAGEEVSYLIGLHITGMDDDARERFLKFLRAAETSTP